MSLVTVSCSPSRSPSSIFLFSPCPSLLCCALYALLYAHNYALYALYNIISLTVCRSDKWPRDPIFDRCLSESASRVDIHRRVERLWLTCCARLSRPTFMPPVSRSRHVGWGQPLDVLPLLCVVRSIHPCMIAARRQPRTLGRARGARARTRRSSIAAFACLGFRFLVHAMHIKRTQKYTYTLAHSKCTWAAADGRPDRKHTHK